MEQINRIQLKGTVGSVRLQEFEGRHAIHMSVATSYVYKGRNGEPVIETTWHFVNAWEGKNIPDVSIFDKGDKVSVLGCVRSQRYTGSDGMERTSYEVNAIRLSKLEIEEQLQYEMM